METIGSGLSINHSNDKLLIGCHLTLKKLMLCMVLVFCSFQVLANDCDKSQFDKDSYFVMLEILGNSRCTSVQNNQTALALEIKNLTSDYSLQQHDVAVQALNLIHEHLKENYSGESNEASSNATILSEAIGTLITEISHREVIPPDQLKRNWGLNQVAELPAALDGMDLMTPLDKPECNLVAEKKCEDIYNRALDLVLAIKLVNKAIDLYTYKFREQQLKDVQLREAKWNSYFDDLTFQYPWEMYINGLWLDWQDEREIVDGNRQGFRAIPHDKVVFIHPDANPLYHKDASEKYELSMTFETVGYERFNFDNITGEVKSSWGISHMAAYLPQRDGSGYDWNTGVMLKLNEYSIGIIDDNEERAIVININLAQKLFDVKESKRAEVSGLKEKLDALKDNLSAIKRQLRQ